MAEPRTYAIWRDMARRVHDAVAPPHYVLSEDEIREGGTCAACRGRDMAQLLGEYLTSQAVPHSS
jgi:hypothetical protein